MTEDFVEPVAGDGAGTTRALRLHGAGTTRDGAGTTRTLRTSTAWLTPVYDADAVRKADTAAREFHRRRGRRSREARLKIAELGRQPGTPTPPFGYYIAHKSDVMSGLVPNSQLGKYLVKEDEARIVRLVFEEYLRTGSCYSIAETLTGIGIATSSGLTTWQPAVVWQMIQNRAYVGKAEYGRAYTETRRWLRGTGVEIPCPAIVDSDLFESVQACLQEEIGTRLLKHAPTRKLNLLHALIWCGDCGTAMVDGIYSPSKRLMRQGGSYYACKSCRPTWNADTPRPDWSTYHGGSVAAMVKEALAELLPESDRGLISEYLFSPAWDVPVWQRRNLLLLGRTRIRVFNRPFRVEVTLGGGAASPEVVEFMARFLVKQGRMAINQDNRDAVMAHGLRAS